jgi:hypothetical protein
MSALARAFDLGAFMDDPRPLYEEIGEFLGVKQQFRLKRRVPGMGEGRGG